MVGSGSTGRLAAVAKLSLRVGHAASLRAVTVLRVLWKLETDSNSP